MVHTLKIQDVYYERIINNLKSFEVRKNDRDFQVGDLINFTAVATCFQRIGTWRIVYVHSILGMQEGYVVLGLVKESEF